MKKLLVLLLILCLLPFSALAEEEYTTYETFLGRYAGNLEFINDNEGRHLISLIFSSGDSEGSFRTYNLAGDVVSAKLRTIGSDRTVASLIVTLTAPANMTPGDATYKDFVTSGYHCYALLMAMSPEETPSERWHLIEELNAGVAEQSEYRTYVGPYLLTARRSEDGRTMEFTFSSVYWEDPQDVVLPEDTPEPEDGTEVPDDGGQTDFSGEEDASDAG